MCASTDAACDAAIGAKHRTCSALRAPSAWTAERQLAVHVLLTKSDKLTRNEARKELEAAAGELGEAASVQLFSSFNKEGADEARRTLEVFLGNKKPGGSGGRTTGSD